MATIAQGMITLNSVNDAFSVSLSPSSCVINADYNGSNPKLTYAYSDIRVIRGDQVVAFDQPTILNKSNAATAKITKIDETTWRITILTIPTTDLNGNFQLQIKVGDEFLTTATFSYTVVRETSMLDWILDWNGTYTEITGKWVITPKIFAGTKNADGEITGVYLGPAFDNNGTGLYGYKEDQIIFQLTETGGLIGGWQINNGGIQTNDGYLKILSEGTIISTPDGEIAWQLNKDGSATFAKGNVKFFANGSATFNGKITSKEGQIGGWNIGEDCISSHGVVLDSDEMIIGVINQHNYTYSSGQQFIRDVVMRGGVYMIYSDTNDYGLRGYSLDMQCVFRLGSTNQIAGWNFDKEALYLGTKNNTARQNTTTSGYVTIGTNGLRGKNWYIDTDGEISFVNGLLHFDENGGIISGWTLNPNRLSNANMALVSDATRCGLYLSLASIAETNSTLIENVIAENGGIVLKANKYGSYFQVWDKSGTPSLYLSSTVEDANYIGRWYFDADAFYYGPKVIEENKYTTSGCITLSPYGLRGSKWRLEATGAGAIAGGKISWDKDGNLTLDNSVKISWSQVTGTDGVMTTATYIDANGIFTGNIDASKITTGTLSASRINADELLSNGNKWALKQDGSGYLANQYISWTANGVLTVKNAIMNNVRINGTIRQPWSRSGVYITLGDESLTYDNIATGATGGWGDGSVASMLTWNLQDSGRIVRLANWKWGSETFDGEVAITAPDGKYFFEDGVAKKKLVFSREIVELIGYADNSTFYGWVVVNRVNFSTRARYGRQLRCLAMGTVTENGTTAPTVKCCTFDGTTISVSKQTDKNNDGIYKVSLPAEWNLESDGYQVMLTGLGEGLVKATLASRTATECVIHVSDDASRNNGSFQFQIFNTNDWIG